MKHSFVFLLLTLNVLCQDDSTQTEFLLLKVTGSNLVGIIFLIIYLSMSWNILYKNLGSKIIEEAIFMTCDTENDNVLKPFVYFISNCLFIVAPVIQALYHSNQYGVGYIIGTEAINFFLIPAILSFYGIVINKKIDKWIFNRDLIFYILGIGLVALFNNQNLQLEALFSFLGYFILYFTIQYNNDEIKEMIIEDILQYNIYEQYNSLKYLKYKKRRNSVTDLQAFMESVQSNQAYLKKLKVAQTVVILNLQNDQNKQKIYNQFQKIVYTVIHMLRIQKNDRKQNQVSKYIEKTNLIEQFHVEDNSDDEEGRGSVVQQFQNSMANLQISQNNNKIKQLMKSKNFAQEQNESQQLEKNLQSQNKQELFNLQNFSIYEKVIYIIMSPIHILLYIIPNYQEHQRVFLLNMLIMIGLTISCSYFINILLQDCCTYMKINKLIIGASIGSFAISYPFIMYNLKVSQKNKQIDHILTFFQLGIYKIAISFALAFMVSLTLETQGTIFKTLSTIVFGYLYGGLFIIGLLLLFLNNNLTVNKVGYTCLYITFLILLGFIKEIQKAQD